MNSFQIVCLSAIGVLVGFSFLVIGLNLYSQALFHKMDRQSNRNG